MNVFNAKLTKRYFIIVLAVILFTLSSIYWITSVVLNSSLERQIQYRDELIASTISRRIGVTMERIVTDLRYVSVYAKDPKGERNVYLKEMERIVSHEPLYLFIQVYDQQGNPLVRVPDRQFPKPLQFTELHQRLSWSKTHYISNLTTLPDGTKTIAIAYPTLDQEGNYMGGVIAYLNLNTLSDYLKEFAIGKKGTNIIVDRNGSIIGDSDMKRIGKPFESHTLTNHLQKDRFGMWEGKLSGEDWIVAYRPMLLGEMGLLTGETIDQAMEPARDVRTLMLQGFSIVLFIATFLTVFGTSRVVKPILQLIKQVKEYKEGKRRKFDFLDTKDELKDLSTVMEQMANQLTEKERRLYYILESIPYGVITTDQDGKVTTMNKGAENLTLYEKEEVIGKYIYELPLKDSKEEFISWKTLREGRAFEEIESYIFDKDKQKHDVIIYSSLFRGENQELIGTILVIRDVSQMKKLEEHLKRSERLASMGQLTAGIAHEIKNPLSIIQAAVEAIQMELNESELENKEMEELTDNILESSDRMNRLLTDFLKLTKGSDVHNRERIDLIHVFEELLNLFRKKLNDQGITIHKQYEVREAPVYGNKDQLIQVFLNILLNSLQAMDQGGEIRFRLLEQSGYWQIEIADTGKGIPEPQLKWIFNPLFSTKNEGTGLGLSIAHEIITHHGGRVWASSTEHKGMTITIQLPKEKGGLT
ncbi:PAS domain S-box-containing protein [Melghirimyces profundicolus]|uniref:histidine kinase n=1 Tax=Melghirimyces profundicolus TaxID=1242148 RepID=A0A2T6C7Z7_9BACL|nr:PAS domain-containing sensor histidine kinase [Melghirimyces profundicolus]PTX64396.1 PAS domain S-box-containing protein [Melghirimyces profundicolus]